MVSDTNCVVFAIIIVILMLFFNKKVRILSVIHNQLYVFKNAKTNKISLWDILCFVLFPILLGIIMAFRLDCCIYKELAGVLTTVFAIVFTVLFGFAAILVGKLNSKNAIEKQVVEETFISIMSATILSFISSILSVAFYVTGNDIMIKILSFCIIAISFMIIMLLLMILKRTFVIYCNNKGLK